MDGTVAENCVCVQRIQAGAFTFFPNSAGFHEETIPTPSKMELGEGVTPGVLHLWFHFPFYGEDYINGIGEPPPPCP